MKTKLYVGIDLHKHFCYVCVKEFNGTVRTQKKVPSKKDELTQFFAKYKEYDIQAVCEATSNYYWLFETLDSLKITVILAHPLKVRAIADARIKSDKIDAGILADLLRSDMIPQSYIPPQEIRYLRELVRHRIRLVRRRSRLKLHVRDILTKCHFQDCFADIAGKTARRYLKEYDLPPVFRLQCDDTLHQIDFLEKQITKVNKIIKDSFSKTPEAQKLEKIRGLGVFSSLLIVSEIGNVNRFPSPKKLVRFAGLCPGLHQSGNTKYNKSITKEGSRYLRWVLCEAVFHAIKVPGPLREFFLSLKRTKGTQKAVIATARKMLVGIYYVLRDDAEFKPVRNKRYSVAA